MVVVGCGGWDDNGWWIKDVEGLAVMSASAILKLQRAGFSTEQVEALAELIDTQAASKTDLDAAEHRLDSRILETKTDLLKIVIGTTIAALAVNSAVVLGAMFGLAKLLGH